MKILYFILIDMVLDVILFAIICIEGILYMGILESAFIKLEP